MKTGSAMTSPRKALSLHPDRPKWLGAWLAFCLLLIAGSNSLLGQNNPDGEDGPCAEAPALV